MTTKAKPRSKKACPACGTSMVFETRQDTVDYKGHVKSFDVTGWWCSSCDEAIFEGPELEAAERAFVELRAEVEGVLLPEEIAAIRNKLNLSQREAGKILGGGPRAFQKYEAGAVPVSAPMNNLLLLLSKDPKRLEELRTLRAKTENRAGRAGVLRERFATATAGKQTAGAKARTRRSKASPATH